jgi:hypothetical protein
LLKLSLRLDSEDSLGEVRGSLGNSGDLLAGLLRGKASSDGAGLLGSQLLGDELLAGEGLAKLRTEISKDRAIRQPFKSTVQYIDVTTQGTPYPLGNP